MRLCGKLFLVTLMVLFSTIVQAQDNNAFGDFMQFENFRRGNGSIDVSAMAVSSFDSGSSSFIGGMVSYRNWDWSYNIRFQTGDIANSSFTLSYLENDSVSYKSMQIEGVHYLSLGVDRKVFQIGRDFFLDGGISVFGINRRGGIKQSEKTQMEDNDLGYDKSFLEYDFGASLNLEGTLYLHRYIGLIGGINMDHTFRDLGSNWFSYFLGFKFYVK